MRENFRQIFIAGAVFLVVVLIGTIGYKLLVDQTTWFDALYMTVITVSTIGYGEMVNLENHTAGRIFTMFIAFSGIGVLTYFLSSVAAAIVEGELNDTFKKSRTSKIIKRMENHYIVCGVGRLGHEIISNLSESGHQLVLADLEEEKLKKVLEEFPKYRGLSGDCTEDDFLEKLGVRNAKGIFITTQDDNINLMITLTARQLNPKIKIVAVARFTTHEKKILAVGANRVISPSKLGAQRMAFEMTRPSVTNFFDNMLSRDEKDLDIQEIQLQANCQGKTIAHFIAENDGVVLAVREDKEWVFNPSPDYELHPNATLVVFTSPQNRKKIEQNINANS